MSFLRRAVGGGNHAENKRLFFLVHVCLLFVSHLSRNDLQVAAQTPNTSSSPTSSAIFSPIVTATCRSGIMTIKVETLNRFVGVVHSRDFRKPECSGYGENSKVTFLRVNMLAEKEDKDYCGIFYNRPDSDERSVAVAVRTHRTLELVDDKFYMITCGKAGFQNSRNQTSLVNLRLLSDEGRGDEKGDDDDDGDDVEDNRVEQVVYGRQYMLRADISHPDGQFGMLVKRCFSFSDTNNTVQLVDDKGCPDKNIVSEFQYDKLKGTAQAKIFSMFKFPESHRVHFQCDIIVCRDDCDSPVCEDNEDDSGSGSGEKNGRSLRPPSAAAAAPAPAPPLSADALFLQPQEDGALMASYSVFVVEPGAEIDASAVCKDCLYRPPWLLYLCIVFGVLFLLMLIVNVFLCSAMTCSCARTDVVQSQSNHDKEQSMIEEFDPYTRSWHGSQYGSRYSLSGGIKPIPPPLISVDTSQSISSSAASDYGGGAGGGGGDRGNSGSGLPAVYGLPVHSRPSSRYSNRSRRSQKRGSHTLPHPHPHSSSSAGSVGYSKYSNGRMIS